MYDDNDGFFSKENLPFPDFFNLIQEIPETVMLYSSASFVRNQTNSNVLIVIPEGADISPNTIWFSPNIYLNDNIFNYVKPIPEITYPSNKDVLILQDLVFIHDILIQYKITKSDGTNFSNQRELRFTLTRLDGSTPYDATLYANQQPDSGFHDMAHLKGSIQHNVNDTVRLKFNIAQDNRNGDHSDTRLTIFRINWNILGITTAAPT